MDAWDVMKSRESDAIADVKKGGGMFPTEPDMSVAPKQGLQKKDVEVHDDVYVDSLRELIGIEDAEYHDGSSC